MEAKITPAATLCKQGRPARQARCRRRLLVCGRLIGRPFRKELTYPIRIAGMRKRAPQDLLQLEAVAVEFDFHVRQIGFLAEQMVDFVLQHHGGIAPCLTPRYAGNRPRKPWSRKNLRTLPAPCLAAR